MAELGQYSFQEVMRQWSRLCGRHNDMMYCEGCPLDASKTCEIVSELRMEDIKDAEKTIMAWAAEYPEPVYPTWAEWLAENGVIGDFENIERDFSEVEILCKMRDMMSKPIPADIAEKFGIKPKEIKP